MYVFNLHMQHNAVKIFYIKSYSCSEHINWYIRTAIYLVLKKSHLKGCYHIYRGKSSGFVFNRYEATFFSCWIIDD